MAPCHGVKAKTASSSELGPWITVSPSLRRSLAGRDVGCLRGPLGIGFRRRIVGECRSVDRDQR